MAEYICKEVRTDNGGYLEVKKELVRCRNCKQRGTKNAKDSNVYLASVLQEV